MNGSKIIPGKYLGGWSLLPAPEGKCQECATEHAAELPHNQQSLFYQYKFYNEHGRWPTWEDAIAHCTDEMKEFWKAELRMRGVDV